MTPPLNIPTAYDDPAKEVQTLVEFRWGDPQSPQWTSYTDGQNNEGNAPDDGVYTSQTAMEVQIPPITGVLKEKSLKIKIPTDDFIARLPRADEIGPVNVRVRERVISTASGGQLDIKTTLFVGRVTQVINNYRGRAGSVLIEAKSWKSRLNFTFNPGIVEHHCILSFGGPLCRNGINLALFRETAQIESINGKYLTTTDPAIVNVEPNYWHKGTVKVDGREIGITRQQDPTTPGDPIRLQLVRFVPPEWALRTATFTAGCNKLYESDCARYENQENFLGPGGAVPSYYPPIETGRGG